MGRSSLKINWLKKPHGCHIINCAMYTLLPTLRGFTSNPRRYPEENRPTARSNPAAYPPGYEMKVAVQEFSKLHKPKINKLKGGYSATANLIFQLWLKDINVHVKDQNFTERRGHSTGQRFYC